MSHFFECVSLWDGFACIDVESTEVSFGGGQHDGPDELGQVEDHAIVFGVGGVGGHEKMSVSLAACFGFAQVGCITVHYKYHVTPPVSDDCVLVCYGVVKELSALLHGVLGGLGLGGSDCAERCEHGGVDCLAVVEENTQYFLYGFLFGGGERRLDVSLGFAYCIVAPYIGIVCEWGRC